ncbi:hypothetical protein [Streptomyces formicae]|uniref:hypothetical protein n=1 Tax=Streptomyces formicae TaxID=1616117 RepID=UPI0018FEBEE3|nr:hypothetical protein [Streptomyces formicae]
MDSQSVANLRSRYVEQVASDLEENRRRQEELAQRIELLKQEETLLADILNLTERYEGLTDAALLPKQAQEEPSVAKAKRRNDTGGDARSSASNGAAPPTGAKANKSPKTKAGASAAKGKGKPDTKSDTKSEAAPGAKSSPKPAPKSRAKAAPRQPLLGDVLLELLSGYTEPRLAQELRNELLEKHPSRNPTPQVVRNTLESLVAKGRVQRHKQQRSVMYTVVKPADAG